MADIVLAECDGTTWLVEGDRHLPDLLRGALCPSVTISVVACATTREALAMWAARAGARDDPDAVPWRVNPAIMRRIKRAVAAPSIAFAPWSALLDADAEEILRLTLERLAGGRVTLRQFCPADAPPGLADLQRLRAMLVAGVLARGGVDPAAVRHETTQPSQSGDENRLDLVTQVPGSG